MKSSFLLSLNKLAVATVLALGASAHADTIQLGQPAYGGNGCP